MSRVLVPMRRTRRRDRHDITRARILMHRGCRCDRYDPMLMHRKCRCDHHKFMRANQVRRKCRCDRHRLMRAHLDASHVQV